MLKFDVQDRMMHNGKNRKHNIDINFDAKILLLKQMVTLRVIIYDSFSLVFNEDQ